MKALVAVGMDGAATLLMRYADDHAVWQAQVEAVGSECPEDLGLHAPRSPGLYVWSGAGEDLAANRLDDGGMRGLWRLASVAEAQRFVSGLPVFRAEDGTYEGSFADALDELIWRAVAPHLRPGTDRSTFMNEVRCVLVQPTADFAWARAALLDATDHHPDLVEGVRDTLDTTRTRGGGQPDVEQRVAAAIDLDRRVYRALDFAVATVRQAADIIQAHVEPSDLDGECAGSREWADATEALLVEFAGDRGILNSAHVPTTDEDSARVDTTVVFMIFTMVDGLLRHGAYDACDRVLAEDLSGLKVVHALALLSATAPAGAHLPHRADFARRVREHLTRDDPARVDTLLAGLE